MSKRRRRIVTNGSESDNVNIQVEQQTSVTKATNAEGTVKKKDPIYRVRLSWDNAASQIFATTNRTDAIDIAINHKGYKVFVGEDGKIACDPWRILKAKEEEENKNPYEGTNIVRYRSLYPGTSLQLNNIPVYRKHNDNIPFTRLTTEVYIYSSEVINDRIRVTKSTDHTKYGKDANIILGWVKIK